eukprot:UN04784
MQFLILLQHQPLYFMDYKKGDTDSEKKNVYKDIIGHYHLEADTTSYFSYTVKHIKYDTKGKYKCALPWKKSGLIITNDNGSTPETPLVWKGSNRDGLGYGGTNVIDTDGRTYWHIAEYRLSSLYFGTNGEDNIKRMWLFTGGNLVLNLEYYTPSKLQSHIGLVIFCLFIIILLVVAGVYYIKKRKQNKVEKAAIGINEFTINTDTDANQQYERL